MLIYTVKTVADEVITVNENLANEIVTIKRIGSDGNLVVVNENETLKTVQVLESRDPDVATVRSSGPQGPRGIQGLKGDKGNTLFAAFFLDPETGLLSCEVDEEYNGPTFEIDASGKLNVIIGETDA